MENDEKSDGPGSRPGYKYGGLGAEYGYDVILHTRARSVQSRFMNEVDLGFRQASFDPFLYARSEFIIPKYEVPMIRMNSYWVDWNNLQAAIERARARWSFEAVEYLYEELTGFLGKVDTGTEAIRIIPTGALADINYRYKLGRSIRVGSRWELEQIHDARRQSLFPDWATISNQNQTGNIQTHYGPGGFATRTARRVVPPPALGLVLGLMRDAIAGYATAYTGQCPARYMDEYRDLLIERLATEAGGLQDLMSAKGVMIQALGRIRITLRMLQTRLNRHVVAGTGVPSQWATLGAYAPDIDYYRHIPADYYVDPVDCDPYAQLTLVLLMRSVLHDLNIINTISAQNFTFFTYPGSSTHQSFLTWNRELERAARILDVIRKCVEYVLTMWRVDKGWAADRMLVDAVNGQWRQMPTLPIMGIKHSWVWSSTTGGNYIPTTLPVQVTRIMTPTEREQCRHLIPLFSYDERSNSWIDQSADFASSELWTTIDGESMQEAMTEVHHGMTEQATAHGQLGDVATAYSTKRPDEQCLIMDYYYQPPEWTDETIEDLLVQIERSTAVQAISSHIEAPPNWQYLDADGNRRSASSFGGMVCLNTNELVLSTRAELVSLHHRANFKFAPSYTDGRHTSGDILLMRSMMDRWGYEKQDAAIPAKAAYGRMVI